MIQKRKVSPYNRGSVKECSISQMEYIEYRQTGMIKVKETPVSRGELRRLSYNDVGYYDFVEGKQNWLEDYILGIND